MTARTRAVVGHVTAAPPPVPDGCPLTPRQLQVLRLIAVGATTGEVAAATWLGAETVNTHVRRILSRTGARTRAHAVHLAHQRGWLADPIATVDPPRRGPHTATCAIWRPRPCDCAHRPTGVST